MADTGGLTRGTCGCSLFVSFCLPSFAHRVPRALNNQDVFLPIVLTDPCKKPPPPRPPQKKRGTKKTIILTQARFKKAIWLWLKIKQEGQTADFGLYPFWNSGFLSHSPFASSHPVWLSGLMAPRLHVGPSAVRLAVCALVCMCVGAGADVCGRGWCACVRCSSNALAVQMPPHETPDLEWPRQVSKDRL